MTEWQMKTAYEKHSGESWNDAQPFARELWENAWVTAKSERGVSASSAQIDEIYLAAQDSRPLSEFREEVRSILSSPQPASEQQDSRCDLGVGCEEAGVCYAMANGRPDRCGAAGPNDKAVYQAIADNYSKDLKAEQQAARRMTEEDVERQYRDGIHIGSGLPRETCPCGLCSKHRFGFNRAAKGDGHAD